MRVAVVGGGIVGLFAAWYLDREGAEVTLYEEGELGAGSVHAAGIIEPTTAYPTNTLSFLKRVYRFWRRGTCVVRRVDARWLVESVRQLERVPLERTDEVLREISDTSVAAYEALAEEKNDFSFTQFGLIERFDDATHFAEEKTLALAHQTTAPVEVREQSGSAGALYFPEVSWLHTERFVARMASELHRVPVVHDRVRAVDLDGSVATRNGVDRFDVVVACTGVSCRKLGVPLTGVRGYGWHVRSTGAPKIATIFVDRGIAVVPFGDEVKVTAGWDFDLSERPFHTASVLDAVRRVVAVDSITASQQGSRPCTPDGLPTVGRKERLVVATGGFRLGWSFAPGLGRHAALLCLDRAQNDPFLSRFCTSLRSGRF